MTSHHAGLHVSQSANGHAKRYAPIDQMTCLRDCACQLFRSVWRRQCKRRASLHRHANVCMQVHAWHPCIYRPG